MKKNGAYVAMKRFDYNYFIDDKGVKDDPISIRVTATDGQVLEDTLPGAKGRAGEEFPGLVQFR